MKNKAHIINPYTNALRSKFIQHRRFFRFFYTGQTLNNGRILLLGAASVIGILSLLLSDDPIELQSWFLIACSILALLFSLGAIFRKWKTR
jgi:hypothetical protein